MKIIKKASKLKMPNPFLLRIKCHLKIHKEGNEVGKIIAYSGSWNKLKD